LFLGAGSLWQVAGQPSPFSDNDGNPDNALTVSATAKGCSFGDGEDAANEGDDNAPGFGFTVFNTTCTFVLAD
jgi:hypothetical protein